MIRFIGRVFTSVASIGIGSLGTYGLWLYYTMGHKPVEALSWTDTTLLYIYGTILLWISVACIVYGMLHREIRDHKRNLK